MSRGRVGRRQLRGKPLTAECVRARISHNEVPGVDACYGLTDYNEGIYNGECERCKALVWNLVNDIASDLQRDVWRSIEGD